MTLPSLSQLKPSELHHIKLAQFPAYNISDAQLQWSVIVARYQDQWVFVKHRARNTLESPGGKREPGETIVDCAHRELFEETGATRYSMDAMTTYAIELPNGMWSYGQLFFATIEAFGARPSSEIEQVICSHQYPQTPTYPQVHLFLLDHIKARYNIK